MGSTVARKSTAIGNKNFSFITKTNSYPRHSRISHNNIWNFPISHHTYNEVTLSYYPPLTN